MPGVQGNYISQQQQPTTRASSTAAVPPVASQKSTSTASTFPKPTRLGDPRFMWTAFGMDSIDQFQVLTSAFAAQYAGQGVENYSIKSGSNSICTARV